MQEVSDMAHGDHRSLFLHVEPHVESSLFFGNEVVYSACDACC